MWIILFHAVQCNGFVTISMANFNILASGLFGLFSEIRDFCCFLFGWLVWVFFSQLTEHGMAVHCRLMSPTAY